MLFKSLHKILYKLTLLYGRDRCFIFSVNEAAALQQICGAWMCADQTDINITFHVSPEEFLCNSKRLAPFTYLLVGWSQ